MTEPIQFRDLHAADARFIELVYHELLEPSFGLDELDPLEVVLDGLAKDGGFELWGLCAMDGDMPVGCILGYPYRESGVLLIGYLVVRDGMRGRGIGGSLADEVRRRWYQDPGLPLVLAEVEDPRYHPVVGDIDPDQRVAFYARRGAQIIVGPVFPATARGRGQAARVRPLADRPARQR